MSTPIVSSPRRCILTKAATSLVRTHLLSRDSGITATKTIQRTTVMLMRGTSGQIKVAVFQAIVNLWVLISTIWALAACMRWSGYKISTFVLFSSPEIRFPQIWPTADRQTLILGDYHMPGSSWDPLVHLIISPSTALSSTPLSVGIGQAMCLVKCARMMYLAR